jgi:pimeloyl-ACP methyl ester carboxylesterase
MRRTVTGSERAGPPGYGRGMATLDLDGARIHYTVEGDGPRALAFAHGWCSKSAHWDAQAERFGSTHRVLRWDRRGMGRSQADAPATSPATHADDLAAILDHEGIERVTVVGHAGGGPTAVAFAARHVDRTEGLVMVDTRLHAVPTDGRPDRWGESIERSAAKLLADGAPYFRRLYASFFGHRASAAIVEDAIANALATPLPVAAAEMRHIVTDTAALASQVACPVLWVSAQPEDTEAVRGWFERVTVGHVVGSGHFVQLEVPEQLNPMIEAFLADEVATTA